MAKSQPLPLYEVISFRNIHRRTIDLAILILLFSIVLYRALSLNNGGGARLVALSCEAWFTLVWLLTINAKWNPLEFKTYPERLLQRGSPELPAVDMFVTTADPELEPPILTVNTVLSLLAADYPSNKLACYVSDDAASPLTFYSLLEALKFAKIWVPFCKKHNVRVRVPFRYFSASGDWSSGSADFQHERKKMKDAYEELKTKIQKVSEAPSPFDFAGEYKAFANIDRRDHPSIIKIIWENGRDSSGDVPHLMYISREKRPKQPHHYKAGAMNVLARVSGAMTKAPIMMNVDCDMYAHNPEVILHAMCLLLGFDDDVNSGFVQFPQMFYGLAKDEPFGNHLVLVQNVVGRGFDGMQGPLYSGTGCFHRRNCIYGAWPDGKPSLNAGTTDETEPHDMLSSLDVAYSVADCNYEHRTEWGEKMGWLYGSAVEDVLTGSGIHARGWRSVYCRPDPPGFLGCAPSDGPTAMIQQKRWASGLLEILFSKHSPVITILTAELQVRQCFAYIWVLTWAFRSIPELCYAVLPAYAILSNTPFIPSGAEFLYLVLVIIYNGSVMMDYLREGFSVRTWLNSQRMCRITTMTAYLFSLVNVALKLAGLSEVVFDITQKEQTPDDATGDDGNDLTFDESPIFVSGTVLTLANLVALASKFLRPRLHLRAGDHVTGVPDMVSSMLVVFCFWPFVKGLIGKGKYGIPASTLWKSVALVVPFVLVSWAD